MRQLDPALLFQRHILNILCLCSKTTFLLSGDSCHYQIGEGYLIYIYLYIYYYVNIYLIHKNPWSMNDPFFSIFGKVRGVSSQTITNKSL